MDLFTLLDYKKIIRECLQEKKQVSARYTFEKMAKYCGVQKTYLSRVLNNDHSHLNQDQLYNAAQYLGLATHERRYLSLLRDWQLSGSPNRKVELEQEIDAFQKKQLQSQSYLKAKKVDQSMAFSEYYLNSNMMLVHMFLSIPRYQKNLDKIAFRLKISRKSLDSLIVSLKSLGLIIETADGAYQATNENTHLPSSSPIFKSYRVMQRIKSMERIQALEGDNSYNFSVTFTSNEAARLQIKKKFLDFLKDIEELVGESSDEEVYQLNFDLFDWSIG